MTVPSLAAFYADDPPPLQGSRARGRPVLARPRRPTFRAAWAQATGELYALKHGRPDCRGGFVRLVSRCTDARAAARQAAGASVGISTQRGR